MKTQPDLHSPYEAPLMSVLRSMPYESVCTSPSGESTLPEVIEEDPIFEEDFN